MRVEGLLNKKLSVIDGNHLTAFKMEIVSKITEPNLVWNIFTYVAEAPLTKEKRKDRDWELQEMIDNNCLDWDNHKTYINNLKKQAKLEVKCYVEDLPEEVIPLDTFTFLLFDKDEYPFRNHYRIDYQLNLIFLTEDGEYKSYKIWGDSFF